MISLRAYAKKLRHVADTIDELFIEPVNENPVTAKKILKKYKKHHWTQKPENKAKLKRILKHAAMVRNAKN